MASGSSSTRASVAPAAPADASDGWIGRVVDGRYRVEAVLGSGGVGVVYRAVHLSLERPVALKVLGASFGADEALRRRFEREARILSGLQHPHVVAVTDYGIGEGSPYLVMELLEGRTLSAFLKEEGPLDPELALRLARDVLRGLAFAHGQGVLHRDLKPANIFLQRLPDDPHHVKLLDFGLAKVLSKEDAVAEGEPTLTGSGVVLGTPTYMAPEQAAGDPADARADVYAAGVVLFELLAGRPPFVGRTRMEVMRAHLGEPPPALADVRPELRASAELRALLDRALAKDREARFADAGEMLAALDALPRPAARLEETRSRPRIGRPSVVDGEAETVAASGSSSAMQDTSVPGSPGAAAARAARLASSGGVRRGRGRSALVLGVAAVGVLVAVVVRLAGPGTDEPAGREAPARTEASGEGSAAAGAEGPAPSSAQDAPKAGAGQEAVGSVREAPTEREASEDVAPDGGSATATTLGMRLTAAQRAALPPPRDPIRRGPPRALRRIYRKVVQGRRLTTREHRSLRRYQREHADDVRASLLLARDFVRRRWFADAVERYRLAFKLDPSSRGSRWMRADLVEIAASESKAAGAAADALAEIYGPEAASVASALARRKLGPARRRLEALAERLAASARRAP